jgi:hypothetical protein
MKNYALFSLALLGTSLAATAGTKDMVLKEVPPPPAPAPCFAAGDFSLDLFAGYVWAADEDSGDGTYGDSATGGIGLNYFFTEMIGVGVDAYWYDSDGAIHSFDGSLIVRFPIQEACIAPYVFGGGGFSTDSTNQGTYHAGAGIEWKASSTFGVFADGRYTWMDDTNDTVLARAGVRFTF